MLYRGKYEQYIRHNNKPDNSGQPRILWLLSMRKEIKMIEDRLNRLLNRDNDDRTRNESLAFYYLYGRLNQLAQYNNSPQARRMMHVVIRNLVEQMQEYVDERLE